MTSAVLGSAFKYTFETFVIGSSNGLKVRYVSSGGVHQRLHQYDQGRDHATVINADRKIRSLMAERRSIYTQVTELTNRIKQQARTS